MYHWTPDMIRFMEDASAYGNYHRRLADMIVPYFKKTGHICDAGCGLGDLSLELSDSFERITAVDIKPQAIAVLRDHCKARGVVNIEAVEGDICLLPPEKRYDGMVFCFFGRSEEILEIVRRQCEGTVCVIKKNYSTHRFSVGKYPTGGDDYSHMQTLLTGLNIPFSCASASLEFGQPFRCFEDVRTFYRCYSRDEDPSVLTDAFLRSKIIETGHERFPLYMPHRREIGLVVFQSRDLR